MELVATTTIFLEKDFALKFLKTWCTLNYSRDWELLRKPFSMAGIFPKKSWNDVSSMEKLLSVTAHYAEVFISWSQMYFTSEVRWKTCNRDGTCTPCGFWKDSFPFSDIGFLFSIFADDIADLFLNTHQHILDNLLNHKSISHNIQKFYMI